MRLFKLDPHKLTPGLVLLIIFLLTGCQADKEDVINKYENFFKQVYARGQFNGNALILEDGEIVFQGSFGIGNIDPIDSLNLNSIFRLGSVSKQFTAMAIMKFKESGRLSYNQDVRDFIPDLPYNGITIRHLLNHVSGLPDYYSLMLEEWLPEFAVDDPKRFVSGNDDIIDFLVEKKPPVHFNPGEKWEYSNTGYVLLASIVAQVSEMPFEKYMKEQIFDPANMSNTSVYNYKVEPDNQMPNRVYGFRVGLNGTDLISNDVHFLNPVQGDGGVYSTLEDLLKWDRILYTDKLISEETREEAFTPAILNNGDTTNYGFGWGISKSPSGKKVVSHSGSWVGFITYIYREVEENNCIIVLTNNSTRYFKTIINPLKNILHDQPYEIPKILINEAIGKIVLKDGVDVAVEQYKKYRTDEPDKYDFSENQLNELGYQLMQLGRVKESIEILRLNMEEFPQSANTFDSFGDALLASGDTVQSLIYFNKALAMDTTLIATKEKILRIEDTMPNKK